MFIQATESHQVTKVAIRKGEMWEGPYKDEPTSQMFVKMIVGEERYKPNSSHSSPEKYDLSTYQIIGPAIFERHIHHYKLR